MVKGPKGRATMAFVATPKAKVSKKKVKLRGVSGNRYKVLYLRGDREKLPDAPETVPADLLNPHRAWTLDRHNLHQPLEVLGNSCGLTWQDIACVLLEDTPLEMPDVVAAYQTVKNIAAKEGIGI